MIVWDDQKRNDYAYQTEFSYQANQLSRRRWFAYNIMGGAVLGVIMAYILYGLSDYYLSDPARMVVAAVCGIWPVTFVEKRAERKTLIARVAMAVTFGIGTVIYAIGMAMTR